MTYIASKPADYVGKVVGSGKYVGQCVVYVQAASGAPNTGLWRAGEKVRGNTDIRAGTAIATFVNGRYLSHSTGNHAAIYVSQDDDGIVVYDQYLGHSVSKRRIHFRGGKVSPSRDGDVFSIIN